MTRDDAVPRLAALLRELRLERGVSRLQLADHAGVKASVARRAELKGNAKLATWEKLFAGLEYRLEFVAIDWSEEAADLLAEEAERRRERRFEGLCAGKRRFY